jgi:hypothetical protein
MAIQLKKSEKTMLILLGGVIAVAIPYFILSGKKKPKVIAQTRDKISQTIAQVVEKKGSSDKANMAAVQYGDWGRDPFSTPELESQKAAASRLVLKGIFISDGQPFALINDVILAAGQEKKGIKVERIEGKKVVCRRGGQQVTLQWSERK